MEAGVLVPYEHAGAPGSGSSPLDVRREDIVGDRSGLSALLPYAIHGDDAVVDYLAGKGQPSQFGRPAGWRQCGDIHVDGTNLVRLSTSRDLAGHPGTHEGHVGIDALFRPPILKST